MKTLIISATEAEISPFLEKMSGSNQDVEVLVTGVGMTATAYALGRHLATADIGLLLNVGIAGSFDKSIALGDVVRVYEDTFSELGAEDGDGFLDIQTLGLGRQRYRETSRLSNEMLESLPQVRGITVNTVHGHAQHIAHIVSRLSPQVESMEGAAVFYAAHQEDIPCLQVRAVSNYVERRERENWQVGKAIENLNRWLVGFVNSCC